MEKRAADGEWKPDSKEFIKQNLFNLHRVKSPVMGCDVSDERSCDFLY